MNKERERHIANKIFWAKNKNRVMTVTCKLMYQESILNEVPRCIHKDKYHLFSIIYETKILIYMYIYIYTYVCIFVVVYVCMYFMKEAGGCGRGPKYLNKLEKGERGEERGEEGRGGR